MRAACRALLMAAAPLILDGPRNAYKMIELVLANLAREVWEREQGVRLCNATAARQ